VRKNVLMQIEKAPLYEVQPGEPSPGEFVFDWSKQARRTTVAPSFEPLTLDTSYFGLGPGYDTLVQSLSDFGVETKEWGFVKTLQAGEKLGVPRRASELAGYSVGMTTSFLPTMTSLGLNIYGSGIRETKKMDKYAGAIATGVSSGVKSSFKKYEGTPAGVAVPGITIDLFRKSSEVMIGTLLGVGGAIAGSIAHEYQKNPEKFLIELGTEIVLFEGALAAAKAGLGFVAHGGITKMKPAFSFGKLKGMPGVTVVRTKKLVSRVGSRGKNIVSKYSPITIKYGKTRVFNLKPTSLTKIVTGKSFVSTMKFKGAFDEIRIPVGYGLKQSWVKGVKSLPLTARSKTLAGLRGVKLKLAPFSPVTKQPWYYSRSYAPTKQWIGLYDPRSKLGIEGLADKVYGAKPIGGSEIGRIGTTFKYGGNKWMLKPSFKQFFTGLPSKTKKTIEFYFGKYSPFEKVPQYQKSFQKVKLTEPVFAREKLGKTTWIKLFGEKKVIAAGEKVGTNKPIASMPVTRFYETTKYTGDAWKLKSSWKEGVKTLPSKMQSKLSIKEDPVITDFLKKQYRGFQQARQQNVFAERLEAVPLSKQTPLKDLFKTAQYNLGREERPFFELKKVIFKKGPVSFEKTVLERVKKHPLSRVVMTKTEAKAPLFKIGSRKMFVVTEGEMKGLATRYTITTPPQSTPLSFSSFYSRSKPTLKPTPKPTPKTSGTGRTVQIMKEQTKPLVGEAVDEPITTSIASSKTIQSKPIVFTSKIMPGSTEKEETFAGAETTIGQRIVSLQPVMVTSLTPMEESKLAFENEVVQSTIQKPRSITLSQTKPMVDVMSDQLMGVTPIQAQASASKQAQVTKVERITIPFQGIDVIQAQAVKTKQREEEETIEKEKVLALPMFLSDGKPRKKKRAFSVQVKTKGKWKTIAASLPEGLAKLTGIKATASTAARTFKLTPSGKTTRPDIPFIPSLTKYRRKKGKSKLPETAYIEKTRFAIDTPGELKEITMKGIKAKKVKVRL